jgi:VIT1/CCC1 family predicted Fe2+/Mn2+ transporter
VKRGKLARPAVFGAFDGTASLLGVVIYLLVTHPALIFPAALSGAISSAVSMGAGEWLSDSEHGFAASSVMAAATFTGALLPALPFALSTGPMAMAESGVICAGIAFIVACLRPNRGLGMALVETFGILLAIFGVVLACGLLLPGAAA